MPSKKNYPGSIERHGARWRVRLCVGGKYHYVSTEGERADAEALARTEYDRLLGKLDPDAPDGVGFIKMSELLKHYEGSVDFKSKAPNTRRSYVHGLAVIRSYFVDQLRDPRVDRIRRRHVKAFMNWRAEKPMRKGRAGVSARTIEKDLRMLSIVLQYGLELEALDANPAMGARPPKYDAREPVLLEEGELERLLTACKDRPMLRAYVLTLADAGLRCEAEALWLRWQDLDFDAGFIKVEGTRKGQRTKNGRSRMVPMVPRLRAALQQHAADFRLQLYNGKRSEWVFHHTRDRRKHKAGQRVRSCRRAFENAVKRAKLPPELRQHDLRHGRVTRWLAAGHPIAKVADAMGHSTTKVTEGYKHLVPEHLRSLAQEQAGEELRQLGT